MANVLTFVWIVIAYIVTSTSLMFWTALMLPQQVERARQRLETRPGRSFGFGLLFWLITVVAALSPVKEGQAAPVQLLGWGLMAPALASSVVGGAAFAELVATRIRAQMTQEARLPALLGGALCTTLAGLLPIIGWVVFFPLVSLMSVGAGAIGLFGGRRTVTHLDAAPAPTPPLADAGFLLPEHQG